MTLPTSRNTTYTPATPVLSADLNDLQDAIVGAKRPALWHWQTPVGLQSAEDGVHLDGVWSIAPFQGGFWKSTAGAPGLTFLTIPIHPTVGDRIIAIGARALGLAANDIVLNLTSFDAVTRVANATPVTIAAPPAAWAKYTGAVTPMTVLDGLEYRIEVTFNGANYGLGPIGYESDRL